MTTRTPSLVLAIGLVLSLGLALPGCNGDSESQVTSDEPEVVEIPEGSRGAGQSFTIPSRIAEVPAIQVTVVEQGDGMSARQGDTVALHYTGTFPDGKVFDTSRDGDLPFEFRIGHGGAIEGWQLIAEQMRVGDRWKATIPSALAYGPRGFPPVIPPHADLVFDMELVRVR